MAWNSAATTTGDTSERAFRVESNGAEIPGLYWRSTSGDNARLVLLGHGGTQHKRAEYIVHVAGLLAARGISSLAIDGPGHGERSRPDVARDDPTAFAKAWHHGGGTQGMLGDWRAALDFIEREEGARPTGWWGLSMGTMMGLPVCATEPRIRVAVLGLMGTRGAPNSHELAEFAPKLQCPVRFLVQWDDEIIPRDGCLELFDRIGSPRKTLHANPGLHSAVPNVEVEASADYLARYLR